MSEENISMRQTDANIERECNFDLLRCISCVTVVILHIAAMYIKEDFSNIVSR